MTLDQFMAGVLAVSERVRYYHVGGCGDPPKGACDCVGLIIGGIREAGGTYTGIHGSNWFARHYTIGLRPLVRSLLCPGDLVYKIREPGSGGYDLPPRYDSDPDRRDYYHIGMVMAAQPLDIISCTTVDGGIAHDSKVGKWSFMGEYVGLEEKPEGGSEKMGMALVTAETGSTVNLRTQPSDKAVVLARIAVGTLVTVKEPGETWSKIDYNGIRGWMMDKYLAPVPGADQGADGPGDLVSVPRDKLVAIHDWLGEVLGK